MTSLQTHTPAVHLPEEDRAAFVMRVYQHVLAAIGAFVAIEALFFMTGVAEGIYNFFSGGKWLLMMGLFMGGQWFVSNAVSDLGNPSRQYAGLFGSSALYAVIFAPILHIVYRVQDSGSTVQAAAVITAIGFAILSFVAFTTRKDLSFLRPLVMWGFGGAMLLIVGRRDLRLQPRRLVLGRNDCALGRSDPVPDPVDHPDLPRRRLRCGSGHAIRFAYDDVLLRASSAHVTRLTANHI